MYILGINGPPHCGKDTIASALANRLDELTTPVKIDHLSRPLRHIAYSMVGRVYDHEDADGYADFKNEIFEQFGCTGRKLMIDVSEEFLKPTYGLEVMARMLLARNKNFDGILIVPDSGFAREVAPLHNACSPIPEARRRQGSPAEWQVNDRLFVARIHRKNTTFKGDSREWVYASHDGDFDNNGGLDDLEERLIPELTARLEALGWPV